MKILIIEDEINIIKMILAQLDWESIGINEILTASQGEKGLEICRTERPDIILTDIEMPVMDGITMLGELRKIEQYSPEVIILTCHADFGYAQKALRFGVREYLVKPFYPEELHAVLLKAVFRRRKSVREHSSQEKQGNLPPENRDRAMRLFAHDLISGNVFRNLKDIENEMLYRGITDFTPSERSRLVCFAYNEEKCSEYDLLPAERSFIFENMVREVVYGISSRDGLNTSFFSKPFYVNVGFLNENSASKEDITKKSTRLINEVERYMKMSVVCVVSAPCTADRFYATRKEIEAVLQELTDNRKTPVFLDNPGENETVVYRKINPSLIYKCIDERKRNDLIIAMKRYLDSYDREISLATLQEIRQRITGIFYDYFSVNNIDSAGILTSYQSRTLYENAAYSTVHMMKYLNYLYDFTLEKLTEGKNRETPIEWAKQYIRTHYKEDIDRDSIAAEIQLSPNYLSHLFHKEAGMSMREYLNECRVVEAKRLLGNTSMTVTEIALSTGFNSIPYFSTVFKKYTDMTPAEYRNAVEKGGSQ